MAPLTPVYKYPDPESCSLNQYPPYYNMEAEEDHNDDVDTEMTDAPNVFAAPAPAPAPVNFAPIPIDPAILAAAPTTPSTNTTTTSTAITNPPAALAPPPAPAPSFPAPHPNQRAINAARATGMGLVDGATVWLCDLCTDDSSVADDTGVITSDRRQLTRHYKLTHRMGAADIRTRVYAMYPKEARR